EGEGAVAVGRTRELWTVEQPIDLRGLHVLERAEAVGVPALWRLDDDRVVQLQLVDLVERKSPGRAVTGHCEVADLARHLRLGVKPDADVIEGAGACRAPGDRLVVVITETRNVHPSENFGVVRMRQNRRLVIGDGLFALALRNYRRRLGR